MKTPNSNSYCFLSHLLFPPPRPFSSSFSNSSLNVHKIPSPQLERKRGGQVVHGHNAGWERNGPLPLTCSFLVKLLVLRCLQLFHRDILPLHAPLRGSYAWGAFCFPDPQLPCFISILVLGSLLLGTGCSAEPSQVPSLGGGPDLIISASSSRRGLLELTLTLHLLLEHAQVWANGSK